MKINKTIPLTMDVQVAFVEMLDELAQVGLNAVAHVGAANYSERQRVAEAWINDKRECLAKRVREAN